METLYNLRDTAVSINSDLNPLYRSTSDLSDSARLTYAVAGLGMLVLGDAIPAPALLVSGGAYALAATTGKEGFSFIGTGSALVGVGIISALAAYTLAGATYTYGKALTILGTKILSGC